MYLSNTQAQSKAEHSQEYSENSSWDFLSETNIMLIVKKNNIYIKSHIHMINLIIIKNIFLTSFCTPLIFFSVAKRKKKCSKVFKMW